MKKVLILTPDFPPNRGGVARYLWALADYFSDRVTVVTSVEGAAREKPFIVKELRLLNKAVWPKWMKSVLLLWKSASLYDTVIVSHVLPFGTAAMVAGWLTKKPFVVIVHGMDIRLAVGNKIKKLVASRVLRHARKVITNSKALGHEVKNHFGVMSPITVYPCITGLSGASSHKKNNGLLRILTVGRLVERKGHAQTLEALARLKKEKRLPLFRYDIVGDGLLFDEIRALANQLQLDEVFLHGAVDDHTLSTFYESADLFVMPVMDHPTDKEGFGLVFLEAAAHGVPSISTNIKGVDEAILDGVTGVLVEPANARELENAIVRLATDVELRQKLGTAAKLRVMQDFTCKKQFNKLEAYLL